MQRIATSVWCQRCCRSATGPLRLRQNLVAAAVQDSRLYATEELSSSQQHHDRDGTAASLAPSLRSALPPSAVELPEMSFLKCISKEMLDEKLRLDKDEGPPPVPAGWTVHHREGTSLIYARRRWMPPPSSTPAENGDENSGGSGEAVVGRPAELHFLRIQLTSRDASLDPECDIRGEHFPFSFFVQRRVSADGDGEAEKNSRHSSGDLSDMDELEHSFYRDSIEVRCDVVDGELVVDHVVHHGSTGIDPAAGSTVDAAESAAVYTNPLGGYPGPNLSETDEEVLDGIQGWLAERGVDDQLGEFVGQYSIWVEQAEYEIWLKQLYDYVAA